MTLLEDARDFFGTDAIQDPYPLYDRMRDQASVHRVGDSVFYAVCGWDAVMEAVNRVEDFSSNLTATMGVSRRRDRHPVRHGASGRASARAGHGR
jgi:cytochrome P450